MYPPNWNLWCYLPTGPGAARVNYGPLIESLSFSTIAPGGFGDLKATLKVPDARIVPDELRPFSRLVLSDSGDECFLGRWDEPSSQMNTEGDVLSLSALGASAVLTDDPQDGSYSAQTMQAIIAAEMSKRSAYLALDSDTSAILPDNPALTFTESFPGQSLEEILNTGMPWLGDYTWAVWEHPRNLDTYGFPTYQLYAHVRDTTTISHTAYFGDTDDIQVTPSLEYSFNVITLLYRDAATDLPASVTVRDSRLNVDLSQGAAPFPMRRARKDYSNFSLSSTSATALANALLNQYMNGGYKITLRLARVRDAGGVELPLTKVRADRNLFLPEFAQYGLNLPFSPTVGTNVWYIQETQYDEPNSGTPTLTLTLSAFRDLAAFQFARLQYAAQLAQKNAKLHQVVKAPGVAETGNCGVSAPGSALAGDVYEQGVNFKTSMSNTPSSITLTPISSANMTASVTNIQTTGFTLRGVVTANGAAAFRATYKTVGN